jgi:hypothetical protein
MRDRLVEIVKKTDLKEKDPAAFPQVGHHVIVGFLPLK